MFRFEAVGCILCELINRRPLFAGASLHRSPSGSISLGFEISVGGKDHVDQIRKIISTLGTPTEAPREDDSFSRSDKGSKVDLRNLLQYEYEDLMEPNQEFGILQVLLLKA